MFLGGHVKHLANLLHHFIWFKNFLWKTGQPGQTGTPISGAPAGTPGSGGTGQRRMHANKTGCKDLVGPKSGN